MKAVRITAPMEIGVAEIEKTMNGRGRVIVRYSGTEPKLRILVEGDDETVVDRVMNQVETLFRQKTEVCK